MTPLTEAEAEHVGDVFAAHADFVATVARRHSSAPDAVPDIVQTVGVHVCRSLRGFRGTSGITTWLYRMTVNAARDHWRAERRQEHVHRVLLERRPGGIRRSGPYPDAGEFPTDVLVEAPDQAALATQHEEVVRQERAVALRGLVERLRPAQAAVMRDTLDGTPVQRTRKNTQTRARQRLRDLVTSDPTFA
jgi:RNA polymerase sigma factor (sigma-70 family)